MEYREKLENQIKSLQDSKSWWTKDTTIGYLFCEAELRNDETIRCHDMIIQLRETLKDYCELQDPDQVDENAQSLLSESFALIKNIENTNH